MGPVTVIGRARDLWTDGVHDLHTEASTELECCIARTGELETIRSDRHPSALQDLVGANLFHGFRRRLSATLPQEVGDQTLLNLLLDDLPIALRVSGVAIQRAHDGPSDPDVLKIIVAATTDVCAGWAEGATIVTAFQQHGQIPGPLGPAAPQLERRDDSEGWHDMPEPSGNTMRRRRCTDVWQTQEPTGFGTHEFSTHFRDSHMDADRHETVVHEYLVSGSIDAGPMRFVEVIPEARVLPWLECPGALQSASRLEGTAIADVRERILTEYRGTSTCTHLNDTLRMLADLVSMSRLLDDRSRLAT